MFHCLQVYRIFLRDLSGTLERISFTRSGGRSESIVIKWIFFFWCNPQIKVGLFTFSSVSDHFPYETAPIVGSFVGQDKTGLKLIIKPVWLALVNRYINRFPSKNASGEICFLLINWNARGETSSADRTIMGWIGETVDSIKSIKIRQLLTQAVTLGSFPYHHINQRHYWFLSW